MLRIFVAFAFVAICALAPERAPAEDITNGVVRAASSGAKYVGRPPAEVARGIAYIDPDARLDVQDVLRQVAWYRTQGMVKGDFNAEEIIGKRYVVPLPPR